jgi:hypothetical protein
MNKVFLFFALQSLILCNAQVPAAAGAISGSNLVCKPATKIYQISAIPNASYYTWTLPSGATGSSNGNFITVTYGSSSVSGNITVKGCNVSGCGTASTLAVNVASTAPILGSIFGNDKMCKISAQNNYTVSSNSPSSIYTWSFNFPSGVGGSSTTNSILVTVGSTATIGSGNITVTSTNGCGVSNTVSKTVNIVPAPTGPIVDDWFAVLGPGTLCKGQTITYSWPTIPNATSYIWELPIGISQALTGATGSVETTSPSITIFVSNSFSSGGMGYYGWNGACKGVTASRPLTAYATPTVTLVGNTLYSSYASGNQWYDDNGIIAGAVNQDFIPTQSGNYYVIVTQSTGCSNNSNAVNFNILSNSSNVFNHSINIYPNPANDKFTIDFGNELNSNYSIKINNMLGQEVYSNIIDKPQFEVTKTWQGQGMYFVKIYNENKILVGTKKIILQ